MAAPYNNLLTKLEGAAGVVYAASSSPSTIFYGIDDTERTVPNVTFIAEQGEEIFPGSGNFRCTLTVQVNTHVNESGADTHAALAATVFDVFIHDTIAASLTAAVSDFHVFSPATGLGLPATQSERTEARLHVSELVLECVACATDL